MHSGSLDHRHRRSGEPTSGHGRRLYIAIVPTWVVTLIVAARWSVGTAASQSPLRVPKYETFPGHRVHPAQRRYAEDHKAGTRTKIVEVAGRMFRREGILASGVAALMTEAGLTPGGLYSHFASKDALVAQVLDEALAKTADSVAGLIAAAVAAGEHPLARAIDANLNEYHLDTVEISCALAFLGSDISRQSDDARVVAALRVQETVEVFADALPAEDRYKAGSRFAMLAATLQMAWLATTREAQMRRLDDGRRATRALVGIS